MSSVDELDYQYFDWIYELVCGTTDDRGSYMRLLRTLHDIPFEWDIPMDANRNADGVNLRYIFGDELQIPDYVIANYLDRSSQASVLEVMAALALRMENDNLHDDAYGDRTSVWFSEMLDSLDIAWADDDNFDRESVEIAIDIFLRRKYDRYGHGGLFVVNLPATHMRNVELWYQMCWWINEHENYGDI